MEYWEAYQKAARETAIYPNVGANLEYATLGLVGEVGELIGKCGQIAIITEQNKRGWVGELGDIIWYLAACYSEIGEPLCVPETIGVAPRPMEGLVEYSCLLAGMVKKKQRDYNNEIGPIKAEVKRVLDHIVFCWYSLCRKYELTSQLVASENIAKLRSRQKRQVLQGSGDNR